MKKTGNRLIMVLGMLLFFGACNVSVKKEITNQSPDNEKNRNDIGIMLDSFNVAAANADFEHYMDYFTEDAVFLGTDATEYWDKKAFMIWAKPHFEAKRTWNFRSIQRHIYFGSVGEIAWFDELLSTQMKICRGSGVVIRKGNQWKVQQYVLSMTIPNDQVDAVIKLKTPVEDSLIKNISGKF